MQILHPLKHPALLGRALRLGAVLGIASLLSGCGIFSWFGGEKDPNPPTKLTETVSEVGATIRWSERLTKGSERRRLMLVPAVGGGRVYVADNRGRIVAADAGSGRVLWERATDLPFSAGPELAGERLILGTGNGLVIALASGDGHEQWRAQVGGEVLSVPRRTPDGRVVVHTLDDTLIGLDESKGTELWRVSYPAPILTLRGSSTPAVTPTGVVVGLGGGKLIKLDPADGAPLWETVVTSPSGRSELARITDIDADPVVVGNSVLVGAYHGDLAAVDLVSGSVLWRRQLSSHAGLAADASDIFITDSEDLVWGADPVGGAGRWKQERLRFRQLTAPALINNLIVVGDLEGWVHLLARTDGRLVGRVRVTKAPIIARPVVVNGLVYVYATDGTLAVISVGTAPRTGSGPGAARADADAAPPPAPPPAAAARTKTPARP